MHTTAQVHKLDVDLHPNLRDVIARFGSRAVMAKWCEITVNSTYGWRVDDDGRLVSEAVINRVFAALVKKEAAERRAAGLPVDDLLGAGAEAGA